MGSVLCILSSNFLSEPVTINYSSSQAKSGEAGNRFAFCFELSSIVCCFSARTPDIFFQISAPKRTDLIIRFIDSELVKAVESHRRSHFSALNRNILLTYQPHGVVAIALFSAFIRVIFVSLFEPQSCYHDSDYCSEVHHNAVAAS